MPTMPIQRFLLSSLALLSIALPIASAAPAPASGDPSLRTAQSQLDTSLRRIPGVISWHFKVFYQLPRNFKLFIQAVEQERKRLAPGDCGRFLIVMSVGSDRKPKEFIGFVPADGHALVRQDRVVMGEDFLCEICAASKVRMAPVPLLTSEAFSALKDGAPKGTTLSAMELADANFAIAAENARLGLDPQGSDQQLVDLLSNDARAIAAGKVILVAREDEPAYRVLNIKTGEVETYQRGSDLRASGNTIYVLSQQGARRWVTAYRNLHTMPAGLAPGDAVTARQKLGTLAGSGKTPPQSEASIETWRISRDDQLFLRDLDDRATLVYGW